jgi:DNA-binding winged helix-turn-helix (wHTH) protein
MYASWPVAAQLPPTTMALYRFGPFEADIEKAELRKFGLRVRLEPKPWQLLLCLLHRPGELVTRAELQSELWAEGTFVDFELGLNVAVKKLRGALGDSADQPKYIETAAGHGYRFIAPVKLVCVSDEQVVSAAAAKPVPVSEPYRDPIRHRVALPMPLSIAAVLVLLGVIAYSGSRLIAKHRSDAEHPGPVVNAVFVQKSGALDPVDEGFKIFRHGEMSWGVMWNPTRDGFDRWKVNSNDQGYYYRTLTRAEKDFAVRTDWKLTCVCAVQRGSAFVEIDFGLSEDTMRFDIGLTQEQGKFFVILTKKISPSWEFDKIEFPGAADLDHPHTYQLRYDHKTKTANLWIDDQLKFSNYYGVDQFREDRGLAFGAYSTKYSEVGIGVFRTVRFEAY